METLIILIAAVLIFTLAILFAVFDTIKRIKGRFNQGWKVLFFAFSVFFLLEFMALLNALNLIQSKLLIQGLGLIFVVVMLVSVIIINKKVREVADHHKKKKYRK